MTLWCVPSTYLNKSIPALGAVLFACSAVAAEPAEASKGPAPDAPLVAPTPEAAATAGTLSIRMSGFRSADGQVLISVFRGEDGFPGEPSKAWKTAIAKISGDRASVDIAAEPGEYAFAILHDENGNNQMDTNWVGIPKEGLGTSNNAKGRMGPPKYRDAKFNVPAEGVVQNIKIVYY